MRLTRDEFMAAIPVQESGEWKWDCKTTGKRIGNMNWLGNA